MAVNPSAFGPKPQFVDGNGNPAVGYKLFSYAAGSSTKQNTYTDSTGNSANTNPIVLNSLGQPTTEIWFTEGSSYKLVLAPSNDTDPPASAIWTVDNLLGINDASISIDQWIVSGVVPTYVSPTSFTVPGDQTSSFTEDRRFKATVTAGTAYGYFSASSYDGVSLTTVTTSNDVGSALDSGLSSIQLGLISTQGTSLPQISDWVKSAMIQDESIIARTLNDSALGFSMINGTLTASVAASALTVSIKTKAGTDPSASDPVLIVFRNSTLATGDYSVTTVTAATSITVSSGSTLGTVSAQASRIYVAGINDAGTFRLGVYNPLNGTSKSVIGLMEDSVYSATAEGGAGAADSAQTLYSDASTTSKPIRILGYVESTQATAGTWATSPSKVQMMSLGVRKTGDVVQRIPLPLTAATFSTASTTFTDLTGLSQAITPTSACNIIHASAYISSGQNGGGNNVFKLVRTSTDLLVGDTAGDRLRIQASVAPGAVTSILGVSLDAYDLPNSTSSITYKIQMAVSSGTGYINRSSTDTDSAIFGRATSMQVLEEIFV
jgi:hypothetical protein